MVPATTPKKKPAATRVTVASVWACSSPVEARSRKVSKITDGGGNNRPLESPMPTAISQPAASVTGSTRPSVGQASRASRLCGAFPAVSLVASRCAADCSAVAVMKKRDMTHATNATGATADSVVPDAPKARAGTHCIDRRWIPALASLGRDDKFSVRHHIAVVDQIIERLFHIDTRTDHAGLLQRDAGFQDRVALRRADLVVDEPGALLELLVDHVGAQLGHADEDLLELVVVGERILARLLVGGDHSLHEIGMVFDELLTRIEDAPGVGVGVAIKQLRTIENLMLG